MTAGHRLLTQRSHVLLLAAPRLVHLGSNPYLSSSMLVLGDGAEVDVHVLSDLVGGAASIAGSELKPPLHTYSAVRCEVEHERREL